MFGTGCSGYKILDNRIQLKISDANGRLGKLFNPLPIMWFGDNE